MKKNGYTLAEVLVTLGVIGLIAAITGPLITKFTPDAEKIAYLKTYDMLSKTINEIARNQTFYPPIFEDEKGLANFANAPLLNLSEVKIGDITIGDITNGNYNKIAKLFGYYTGLKKLEEVNNIKDDYQSEKYKEEETPDFITKDGAGIYMTTKISTFKEEDGTKEDYQTEVYVDINGTDKGKNCLYDSTTCVKPDIFKFILTAAGEVIPADAMGNGYFKTRNSWKALKNNDIAEEPDFPDNYFQTNLSELILIKKEQEEGLYLPWSPIEIKPVPSVTHDEGDDDSDPGAGAGAGTGAGGGGGGIDEDQNAGNPCNLCTPPWTECRRGVCVNPYDHERNKTKTEAMQDMLDDLDSPQNLRQNTGSSSVPLY